MNLEVGGEEVNLKVSERKTDSAMQIKCFKAIETLEHSAAQQKEKATQPSKHS